MHRRPSVCCVEIPEVVIPVERKETHFIFAGPEQIGRQACAAAHHLQELDFRVHLLEEHQVHRVGDIHAGVQHVDAYGNLGELVSFSEVVDGVQRVFNLAVDEFAEFVTQVIVLLMEFFDDDFRFDVILREDDGLANLVTCINLQAVLHEVVEHGADCSTVNVACVRRDYRMSQ